MSYFSSTFITSKKEPIVIRTSNLNYFLCFTEKFKLCLEKDVLNWINKSRNENKVVEAPLYFAYSTALVSRMTVTFM